MKRVLILAYYYPPIATSGSLRPAGFSRHLQEHGYIPHIVSTDPHDAHPPIAIDQSLARLIPETVQVDRLVHLNLLKELLDFRERLSNRPRATEPTSDQPIPGADDSTTGVEGRGLNMAFRCLKSELLSRIFLFPDHQKPWISAVMNHVKSLPRENRPQLVYATANPWSALVAGQRVADQLGIPFVADFRDPWTRNPKPQASDTLAKKALRLEQKIVRRADCVIANTEELRLAFVEDYPEFASKFVTITNGFNDILLKQDDMDSITVEKQAATELCHFGSVYELRKPLHLLQSVDQLIREGALAPSDLKIRFIGNWLVESTECNRLVDELENKGFVSREPPLSHEAYLQEMRRADMLLILQQDFPLQIPGKIYEYISTGRPIVVVGGHGATANLIDQHRLGVAFPDRVNELKTHLVELVKGEKSLNAAKVSQIQNFSYSSLTEKLAVVFDSLT
jgi:Glycosyltransferase Family 4